MTLRLTKMIPALAVLLLASAHAAEFRVADFGAAGDGTTDDAPPARKALAAAIEAKPGSKRVFEEKPYRFAPQSGDAILTLDGVEGIMLEGNGAEIIGTPWNAFLRMTVTSSWVEGIGEEEGVMRRDPSDIIKVKDLYYVWYSKGAFPHGYDASVLYDTSRDGRRWAEKGEALARGPQGSWDEQSVFSPNILVAEEVRNTFQYAEDGITFTKMMKAPGGSPTGAGLYRPEAFTDSGKGNMIEWGLEIRGKRGALPFLGRFDCAWKGP